MIENIINFYLESHKYYYKYHKSLGSEKLRARYSINTSNKTLRKINCMRLIEHVCDDVLTWDRMTVVISGWETNDDIPKTES